MASVSTDYTAHLEWQDSLHPIGSLDPKDRAAALAGRRALTDYCLTPNLRHISLSHACIGTLPRTLRPECLLTLILTHCHLRALPPNLNLGAVVVCDLSHNLLEEWPGPMPSVQTLNLSHNRIKTPVDSRAPSPCIALTLTGFDPNQLALSSSSGDGSRTNVIITGNIAVQIFREAIRQQASFTPQAPASRTFARLKFLDTRSNHMRENPLIYAPLLVTWRSDCELELARIERSNSVRSLGACSKAASPVSRPTTPKETIRAVE